MKKKLITAVILWTICLSFTTDAQNSLGTPDKAKVAFSLTGGFTTPFGNFKKSDYLDPKSGFAANGYHVGLAATYFFTQHLGLNMVGSYRQFGFRGIQQISDGFHEAFDVDSTSASTRGSSHMVSFLVGPYYSLTILKKLSVDFEYTMGVTGCTLAGWDVLLTDAGITHPPLTQNQASALSFGYEFGTGIRYLLKPHWSVVAKGTYFFAHPDFPVTNIDRLANAGRLITNYNQQISGIEINLSLICQL